MFRPLAGPLLSGLIAACLALPTACRAPGPGSARLAFPIEQAHAPRERVMDVLGYAIELELLPESRAIRAECRVRLPPLAGLILKKES